MIIAFLAHILPIIRLEIAMKNAIERFMESVVSAFELSSVVVPVELIWLFCWLVSSPSKHLTVPLSVHISSVIYSEVS